MSKVPRGEQIGKECHSGGNENENNKGRNGATTAKKVMEQKKDNGQEVGNWKERLRTRSNSSKVPVEDKKRAHDEGRNRRSKRASEMREEDKAREKWREETRRNCREEKRKEQGRVEKAQLTKETEKVQKSSVKSRRNVEKTRTKPIAEEKTILNLRRSRRGKGTPEEYPEMENIVLPKELNSSSTPTSTSARVESMKVCDICENSYPESHLPWHKEYIHNYQAQCELCAVEFALSQMEEHYSEAHGVVEDGVIFCREEGCGTAKFYSRLRRLRLVAHLEEFHGWDLEAAVDVARKIFGKNKTLRDYHLKKPLLDSVEVQSSPEGHPELSSGQEESKNVADFDLWLESLLE